MFGYKDLSGLKFGKLFVPAQTPSKNSSGELEWKCVCECGKQTTVRGYSLRRGSTTSCGCNRGENGKQSWTTHGRSQSAEYGHWLAMIRRCSVPDNQDYAYYGGRGIRVCSRWANNINAFIEDMGPIPGPEFTIDRVDGNGNYEPGNCRWSTREEQSNNRRHVRKYEVDGQLMSIAQIARQKNIPYSTLFDRVNKNGMSLEQALNVPIRGRE